MDVKIMIEAGGYRKEDLPEPKRMYIEGMENVLEEIETYRANMLNPEGENILERISSECANETLDELKEYLEVTIGETLVSLADSEEAKEGKENHHGEE